MARGRRQAETSNVTTGRSSLVAHQEVCALPLRHATTAKGVPVALAYDWDHQDGIGGPFVVQRLRAEVDGAAAGYVKLAYVPRRKMDATRPNALHFALREDDFSGHEVSERLLRSPLEEWSSDEVVQLIQVLRAHTGVSLADLSHEALIAEWEQIRDRLTKRTERRYREYIEAHVDRPRVDFIRVFDKGDRIDPRSDDDRKATRDYRRLGVATVLYETAARWMAANNMRVWASGLQQPGAVAVWEQFEARGLVRSVTRSDGVVRRYFDAAALDRGRSAAR